MGYNTNEMFLLANHLKAASFTNVQAEGLERAAINRCYYACFLAARDRLWGLGGEPTGTQRQRLPKGVTGSHERTITALGVNRNPKSGSKGIRQKNLLGQLKDMRIAADYKTDAQAQALFTQYNITTWGDLAAQALALTTHLLPELATVPPFQ